MILIKFHFNAIIKLILDDFNIISDQFIFDDIRNL